MYEYKFFYCTIILKDYLGLFNQKKSIYYNRCYIFQTKYNSLIFEKRMSVMSSLNFNLLDRRVKCPLIEVTIYSEWKNKEFVETICWKQIFYYSSCQYLDTSPENIKFGLINMSGFKLILYKALI